MKQERGTKNEARSARHRLAAAWTGAGIAALLTVSAPGAEDGKTAADPVPDPDPGRFAKSIAAFEASDRERPPPPRAVLFTGSSSIRGWQTLAGDFPDYKVINRGFGGSQISDLIHYTPRVVLPYRPAYIVVYCGDNDIGNGKTPSRVLDDYVRFIGLVRRELPDTPVAFIAIKPSYKRWELLDQVAEANRLVQTYCLGQPGLEYIDIYHPMMGAGGSLRRDLFVADGLHLSREGYRFWARLVRPYLDAAPPETRRGAAAPEGKPRP